MLTILGCLPESTEPPASQSGAAKPAGQQLTRRLEGDVGTLNFVLHTTDAERQVLDYVHEPLVNLDRNLRPAPGTAASWEIAPDGRTFTFRIDPRATFSDGRPVRAEDVLFTVNRIVDEQSPQFASMFDALDRSQSSVIDPRTVKFVFREPRAAQLLAFHVAVLPEHVYGQGNFKSDFNDTAVGNGPYTVVRFDRGRQILLKRREDYWGARPDIAAVSFQVIADDGAAWLAAKTGRLDEMRVKPDIWAAEKDDPQVRAAVTFYDTWTLSYNCIAWNTEDPLLKDPRVRRALAMAYDTQSIISGLYRGEARPLTGPFTPDQAAYNHDVKPIPFDPSAAAALLQQAGWRDSNGDRIADQRGRKLQIEMLIPSGHGTAMQQSQVFQATLKQAGVALDIRPIDGAAMFQAVMTGNFQAAFMGWTNDAEPDLYPLFHSSQVPPNGMNVVRYSNPDADRLIEQARVEQDEGKRVALQRRLHALIAGDQPYLFTTQVATKWAVSQRVKNVQAAKGVGLFFWRPGPLAWAIAE